jgi:hypothetical protein
MDAPRDKRVLAGSAHLLTTGSAKKPEEQQRYLQATPLLDYHHPALMRLVQKWHWNELDTYDQIEAIYDFVQNEIEFGDNESDSIPASQVLQAGYGQCNTKGILLMALLRCVGVACLLHGFTIDKALQRGAGSGLAYLLAPRHITHSWVEVCYQGRWVNLEGFILDKRYLVSLQRMSRRSTGPFMAMAWLLLPSGTHRSTGRGRIPQFKKRALPTIMARSTHLMTFFASRAPICQGYCNSCSSTW